MKESPLTKASQPSLETTDKNDEDSFATSNSTFPIWYEHSAYSSLQIVVDNCCNILGVLDNLFHVNLFIFYDVLRYTQSCLSYL